MNYTVSDIAKIIKTSKKTTPLVIFTGAGCSKSAGMPLASDLVKEINKQYKTNLKGLTEEEKQDYGICMAKLVPREQKALLEKYLNKAKINWAHIALASLLKKGHVAKVLTFNFDNILTKACSLDNFYPAVYDLKVLSPDYFSAIPSQSIIHLHGQWSGFELANSSQDTQQQAEKLKNYIKETLNNATCLFIGYSGGADAFFKLVEENFIGQHRLFWIDYANQPNKNVSKFINIKPEHRHFIGGQDADQFLLELATELKCFPTAMFTDPIQHLTAICEGINNFPLLHNQENHIDLLAEVKNTLKMANASKPLITVMKLAESLQQKKYDYLINWYKNNPNDAQQEPIKKIIATAYLAKSIELLNNNNNQYDIYFNQAIEILPNFYQAHAQLASNLLSAYQKSKNNSELEKALHHLETVFNIKPHLKDTNIIGNYGLALADSAKIKKDEILFNQAFEKYQQALAIQPNHINILNNYGSALGNLANIKQDEALFKQAIEKYQQALAIQPNHTDILNNYGLALTNLANIKQDETLFNQAFEKYQQALAIQPKNANILNNYGFALANLANIKQNETLFNQAFDKYQQALTIEPNDADTLNNYGAALADLANIKQDENLFNQAFDKYQQALAIQPNHTNTLNNYGNALFNLAKIKQDEVLFNQAFDKLSQALAIKPNETYNMACYYAITHQYTLCEEFLLHAEKHHTLPTPPYQHLTNDKDFDNIRQQTWFIELLARLKN